MEHQIHEVREIARLEALVAGDPGAPAFPALAEANRRAGRAEEAERVAREGLRHDPDHLAGRVALALALLELGRTDEARDQLERVLQVEPGHALARAARAGEPEPLEALDEDELEQAFADAESDADSMRSAHDVAAEAMRAAALDEPEGVFTAADSPFVTETVASLLAHQGHGDEARALRARAQERSGGGPSRDERDRAIATLESWLENLRRPRS